MSRSTLDPAVPLSLSLTGLSPSPAGLSRTVLLTLGINYAVRTPACTHTGLGSFAFARRYLRNRCFFLFLWLLRCFSSPGSLLIPYFIQVWVVEVFSTRFPHSDISGSLLICSSPKLFAAYHVFRRLSVPRHPPCALYCMIALLLACNLLCLHLINVWFVFSDVFKHFYSIT